MPRLKRILAVGNMPLKEDTGRTSILHNDPEIPYPLSAYLRPDTQKRSKRKNECTEEAKKCENFNLTF